MDALHITAGGRYTEDKKHGILTFSRNIDYRVNTTAATANGYKPLDKTWHRFDRVPGDARTGGGQAWRCGGGHHRGCRE